MEKELAIRKEKKSQSPTFTRHASHRKKKLADGVWRKPKGLQNKLRLRKKSRGAAVKDGYRTPVKVRGLSASGKKQFLVSTKSDIHNAEPEVHALIIAKVGDKRRLELLEEATKQGFDVINHDVKAQTETIKGKASARAKKRTERKSKQAALVAAADKKAADKAASAAKKTTTPKKSAETAEEKAAEKKEQDKILTKKDSQV